MIQYRRQLRNYTCPTTEHNCQVHLCLDCIIVYMCLQKQISLSSVEFTFRKTRKDSKVYLLAPSNKPIRQPNHTFFFYLENIPARKSNMGIRATEYNPYKVDFVSNCKLVHSNSRAVACELFYNKDHLVLFTL